MSVCDIETTFVPHSPTNVTSTAHTRVEMTLVLAARFGPDPYPAAVDVRRRTPEFVRALDKAVPI
jgi:hypothetical protein